MKSKSDIEIKAGGGCSIRALFGFLWDFRERQVNQLSFWYGFLHATALCWIVRWAIDGIDQAFYWRAPLVIMACIAAKWCQSRHTLKCDPNAIAQTPPDDGTKNL